MKNRTKTILCTVSVIGVVGISGIMAYLTDTDVKKNNFTIGKVEIELQEPEWDGATDTDGDDIPDYAEDLSANQTIKKDPQVKNTGKNDAYVYLKVTVPVANVITAESDGTLKNEGQKSETELFTFSTKDKWKLKGAKQKNTKPDGEDGSVTESYTYIYYYSEKLQPGQTTETLFDTVTFANVIEGQVDTKEYQIDIEAYAIQSDNLPEGTTAEKAYDIYLQQNKEE